MGVFSKLAGLFSSKKKKKTFAAPVNIDKRFELNPAKIGQGSMSRVHRARDFKLGRVTCIKILDREKCLRFDSRFRGLRKPTEGAICMALRHPNIVQTLDFGISTKGEQFIVMELIEGVGLNFLIDTHSAQLSGNRINYLVQAAEAVDVMHQLGFLHRDICPRNMMINTDGVLKLIDFGLSIPYRPEFCRAGNRTGTIDYLAPELIKRLPTDHRVDLFALGVTAYHLFTADLPWEKGESHQTLLRHVNTPGKNPRELRPDLDDKTVAFLVRAIDRDPRERFQSALEFRDALKNLPHQ
jgi:serine/threonine protein kinase